MATMTLNVPNRRSITNVNSKLRYMFACPSEFQLDLIEANACRLWQVHSSQLIPGLQLVHVQHWNVCIIILHGLCNQLLIVHLCHLRIFVVRTEWSISRYVTVMYTSGSRKAVRMSTNVRRISISLTMIRFYLCLSS